MKKVFKIISSNILIFILGGIVCSGIIVLADTIASSQVTYDNSASGANANNVKDALDSLYKGLMDITKVTGSGLSLIGNTPEGLSDDLIAGLYRYQGANVNNYICFGTTDKDTCVGNKNIYLYRIIGINSLGEMKLIKSRNLNSYRWSSAAGVDWPDSELCNGLNGDYFYNNTTYVPTDDNGINWKSKIIITDWHYYVGGDISASTIANFELNAPVTNKYIGLMYLHDYAYAYSSIPEYNKDSWIQLYQNATVWTSEEYTITRYDDVHAWYILGYNNGGQPHAPDNSSYTRFYRVRFVRPVFFLNSNEVISSGFGTENNPYILE